MITSDQIAFISILIAASATLFAAISVIINGWQTRLLARSIQELSKQTRISSILSATEHFQKVDGRIMDDSDLLSLLPYEKHDVFAAMLLNGYSARYRLKEEEVITEEEWKEDLPSFQDMLAYPFVQAAWGKLKHVYTEDFRTEVERNMSRTQGDGQTPADRDKVSA